MTSRGVALALVLAATGCNIDFDAAVPCTTDDECPTSMFCDLDFERCVDEPAEARGDDVRADVVEDAPADTNVDAPLDVATDGSGDVAADVGDDAVDAPPDAPTDGSGDAADDVLDDADGGCEPTLEVCDGVDNDCDGDVDEDDVCAGCGAGSVLVEREGVEPFCIDQYEASRPDATADDPGSDGSRAVSQPGVLPWANITIDQATAACEAAGKRLCSAVEWVEACQGPEARLYPYGTAYDGLACNGANTPPLNAAAAVGSFDACVSSDTTFDQSGNLAEWVSDLSVRGGAFEDPQLNLQCRSRRIPPSSDGPSPAFGFRCCDDP